MLAWFLAEGEHLLPIPVASKVAGIEGNLRGMNLILDLVDIQAIDRLPDEQ